MFISCDEPSRKHGFSSSVYAFPKKSPRIEPNANLMQLNTYELALSLRLRESLHDAGNVSSANCTFNWLFARRAGVVPCLSVSTKYFLSTKTD